MAYQQHTKPDINITAALKSSGAASREAIAIVRDLIDHILVTPTQRPDPVDLTVVGNLAALTAGDMLALERCHLVHSQMQHGVDELLVKIVHKPGNTARAA